MKSLEFQSGVIVDKSRPEFSRTLRELGQSDILHVPMPSKPLEQKYGHQIKLTERIIIAGAAGTKVASAASALCRGGIMSGLYATQRNDHMVTVKSGYSIAEVILSTEPINYTTITKPDRIIVPFSEGFSKIRTMIESLDGPQVIYINSALLPIQTAAKVYTINFQKSGKKKEYWSIMAIAEMLRHSKIYPIDAFVEALAVRKEFAQGNIAAVRASSELLESR